MNRIIGTSEIYEYAEKYNMDVGKDIPLTMGWCFDMVDKAYEQGRADAIDDVKHQMISFHTDMIFRYGADTIEARCDAFNELEAWIKEQK